MNIRHNITYTVQDKDGTLYEENTLLWRNRVLTEKGCERILNRKLNRVQLLREETVKVNVTRIQTMIENW